MAKKLETSGISYDALTQQQKQFFNEHIWNGVGSRHFFINPHDLIFKEASVYHDFYYWRGGSNELRVLADKDFLSRCLDKIQKLPPKRRPFYYVAAYTYYFFLKTFGKAAWEKGEVCKTWEELMLRFQSKR
jgi:hypothetical protein